jgi:hypothetical protein
VVSAQEVVATGFESAEVLFFEQRDALVAEIHLIPHSQEKSVAY